MTENKKNPPEAETLPFPPQEEINHLNDERHESNEEKLEELGKRVNEMIGVINTIAGLSEKLDLRVKLIEQKIAYEAALSAESSK